MARQWEFYQAPGGGNVVSREINSCCPSKHEMATLKKKMDKVAECGTHAPGVAPLGDGVWEIKFSVHPKKFRLAFAVVEDGHVLLGLHFFKKDQQRQKEDVDRAKLRLRDWKARQP